jgi:hypothetical protein
LARLLGIDADLPQSQVRTLLFNLGRHRVGLGLLQVLYGGG